MNEKPASGHGQVSATIGLPGCRHQSKPHTIWWWLYDPNDPVPAPYSQTFDNRADAMEFVALWLDEPPATLRWIKVFRADNEAYTCWRWSNHAPLPAPPPPRRLSIKRSGRNMYGKRVLAASCPCGWEHMTAYPLLRRRSRATYLMRRFNAHACLPHNNGGSDD